MADACRGSFRGNSSRASRAVVRQSEQEVRCIRVILQRGRAGMPKFATVGTIEVAPGRRDQLLPLLVTHKARCLKDEPGTLQFEILLPHDDDTKILLYEVYRDDAAFEVHRNGPSFARWREETAGMVARIYGTRCAVLD